MPKTVEELQDEILNLQEELKTKDETILTLTNDVEQYKTKEEEYVKTIQDTREMNSKLALKVSEQVFTPQEPKKEEPEEEKVLSLDEIAKHF